jgi:hypothetical protein
MRWAPEIVEPGFDYGNFGVDLVDQQTEIEAGPSLQMNRQFLPVRPEIFERLSVVQLNIRAHSFLNCIRHEGLLQTKKADVQKGRV